MSDKLRAAAVVSRMENVSIGYLLAMYSEQELTERAIRCNREREEQMESIRESW